MEYVAKPVKVNVYKVGSEQSIVIGDRVVALYPGNVVVEYENGDKEVLVSEDKLNERFYLSAENRKIPLYVYSPEKLQKKRIALDGRPGFQKTANKIKNFFSSLNISIKMAPVKLSGYEASKEENKFHEPAVDMFLKLCYFYNVSPLELLTPTYPIVRNAVVESEEEIKRKKKVVDKFSNWLDEDEEKDSLNLTKKEFEIETI